MTYSLLAIIFMGIANFIWRLKPKNRTLVILLLVGIYGCWQVMYPSGSFRYKLTIVVDDNGKQIVASSVREIHIRVAPRITPETNNSINVRGEAVAVDLGEKGVLFALLRSDSSVDYGYYIVFDNFHASMGASTEKGIEYYTHLKAKKELAFDKLPMLVRFKDINDPKTVEKVDPYNLEASFGKGVKLVSATLEMTDERVTSGVEEKLGWLGKINGGYLDGQFASISNELSNVLHGGDFERK